MSKEPGTTEQRMMWYYSVQNGYLQKGVGKLVFILLRVILGVCIIYIIELYIFRCNGEGNGNPLQYSCLENPMDRGAWQATVHGVSRVR